jgi:hypothetical protein
MQEHKSQQKSPQPKSFGSTRGLRRRKTIHDVLDAGSRLAYGLAHGQQGFEFALEKGTAYEVDEECGCATEPCFKRRFGWVRS